MRSRAQRALRLRLGLAVTAGLLPTTAAWAEPSVGGAHLPILGLVILVGAAGVASLPFAARKFLAVQAPSWKFWLASAILAALFLVFLGPLILVLGSILLTGRTM